MRQIKVIKLSLIDIDRLPIQKRTLDYANLLLAGTVFPPIKLYKKTKGRYQIKDGRHRFLAHKLAGKIEILATFSDKLFNNINIKQK